MATAATPSKYDPSIEGKEDLQLYSLGTPNGHKITIFLEEAGIPYDLHTINISKNTQFGMRTAFLLCCRHFLT